MSGDTVAVPRAALETMLREATGLGNEFRQARKELNRALLNATARAEALASLPEVPDVVWGTMEKEADEGAPLRTFDEVLDQVGLTRDDLVDPDPLSIAHPAWSPDRALVEPVALAMYAQDSGTADPPEWDGETAYRFRMTAGAAISVVLADLGEDELRDLLRETQARRYGFPGFAALRPVDLIGIVAQDADAALATVRDYLGRTTV